MSHRQRKAGRPIVSLRIGLQQFGDEFYASLKAEREAERKRVVEAAQSEHYRKFQAAHRKYLTAEFGRHKKSNSEEYREFEKERRESASRLKNNPFRIQVKQVAPMDGTLEHFVMFLALRRKSGVLDFWEWDEQKNPERFSFGERSL